MSSFRSGGRLVSAFLSCALLFFGADTEHSPWRLVQLPTLPDQQLNRIVFANERVGWISAGRNTIVKTIDGGKRWFVLDTNLAKPQTDVSSLWFVDESRGWAAGTTDRRPTIWETDNGGVSWTVEHTWPRADADSLGAILDICFIDKIHGWAVGFNGINAIIAATEDGGQHWKTQYSGSEITGQFHRVRFSDRLHGWSLSSTALMQTEDGGESWRLQHFGGPLFNDIDVLGPSQAWVAGASGYLMHNNGWKGWHRVPVSGPLSNTFLGYVKFIDKDRGWASGTKGEIVMTRDSGKTWIQEKSPLGSGSYPEIITGDMASNKSRLFMLASPGYLLHRALD